MSCQSWTSHCPWAFQPHARTVPSKRSPSVWDLPVLPATWTPPAATATTSRHSDVRHSPPESAPVATTVPSGRHPTVCRRPAANGRRTGTATSFTTGSLANFPASRMVALVYPSCACAVALADDGVDWRFRRRMAVLPSSPGTKRGRKTVQRRVATLNCRTSAIRARGRGVRGDVAVRVGLLWEGTKNEEPGRGSAALRWLRRGGWASQERPCRVRSHTGRRPIDLTSSASDFSSSTETLTRLLAKALSGRPWTISHSLSQQRTGNDETRPAGTP